MADDGVRKAAAGMTTMEEVVRMLGLRKAGG
jgi:type II secretory ATPase GspE/PulE/Tfp pilus assembly ATPase PilB-like protein